MSRYKRCDACGRELISYAEDFMAMGDNAINLCGGCIDELRIRHTAKHGEADTWTERRLYALLVDSLRAMVAEHE